MKESIPLRCSLGRKCHLHPVTSTSRQIGRAHTGSHGEVELATSLFGVAQLSLLAFNVALSSCLASFHQLRFLGCFGCVAASSLGKLLHPWSQVGLCSLVPFGCCLVQHSHGAHSTARSRQVLRSVRHSGGGVTGPTLFREHHLSLFPTAGLTGFLRSRSNVLHV